MGEHYFTSKHEQAIIDYIECKDLYKKNQIFEKIIHPVFIEMIEKIVFTFKFTALPNVDVHKDECIVYLTTILCNFDKSKGYKAFSYFSVITKNYFIAATKKQAKRLKHEISFDEIVDDHDALILEPVKEDEMSQKQYFDFMITNIKNWENEVTRENDKKILSAVNQLFENRENLDLENKRAIYLYIRELTGLNTKQVNASLTSLKKRYREFAWDWKENG